MLTAQDIDLLEALAVIESRNNFFCFRRFIHPEMIVGWWQKLIAKSLEEFYNSYLSGERPKLVIEAPPQHGKSQMIVDFIAWIAGKDPKIKTIYTSFSERLGVRANLALQRILDSRQYCLTFPKTRIKNSGSDATRSRSLLEFIGYDGYFRNTTVQGSITGESLDIGVIDDPIKGREAATSKNARDKAWDWLLADFMTRFSDKAGMIAILTRWHVDDPIGRLKNELGDDIKVISYPAIAVKDEEFRKKGEPLFPQHKTLDFLLERKKVFSTTDWEALYQQNPQIIGGEIIKGVWFKRYKVLPNLKYRVIFADTAMKTQERNDYTVIQCWGVSEENNLYLIDQRRGKWEAPELKQTVIDFWKKHKSGNRNILGDLRKLGIEDKSSGTGLIQELTRSHAIPVKSIQRVKDKYTRLLDVVVYIESGRVFLPEDSDFVNDFIDECESFTADNSHKHDDQVDPMIDAINDCLSEFDSIAHWTS